MNQTRPNPITFEEIQKLGGALHSLAELGDTKILTAERAAEKRGLEQYVTETIRRHANELIACWLTMHNEYEPLIMGFVGLLSRANSVLVAQAHARGLQAGPPAEEPQPDNVVSLELK